MEVDEGNPSEIRRLLANKPLIANLNRKRKLQADLFDLPFSKHQCGNRSLLPKPQSTFDGSQLDDESSSCSTKVKPEEAGSLDDASGASSLKDSSNSFGGNYAWGSRSSALDSNPSLDCSTTVITSDIEDDQEMSSDAFGEIDPEYENHTDYIYSGYGNYIMEQYQNKEIEEIPETSDSNANVYVLSSGRWTPNQETRTQQSARKPTIDQEFEHYFSTLML